MLVGAKRSSLLAHQNCQEKIPSFCRAVAIISAPDLMLTVHYMLSYCSYRGSRGLLDRVTNSERTFDVLSQEKSWVGRGPRGYEYRQRSGAS